MNLLPVPRANVAPEAPQPSLERRNALLWVTVGSRLGETTWYPPVAATFEMIYPNTAANTDEVNFGLSPWSWPVTLRYVAVGPEPDDFRVMCLLDNRDLLLPPGGIMLFSRHALSIGFEPPFTVPAGS